MANLKHRAVNVLLLTVLLAGANGCSGLWEPKQSEVEGWVASVPPGSPGSKIFRLLERKGFAPHYENPRLIEAGRTYHRLVFADFFFIEVDLDKDGRVVSSHVSMGRNFL
jgi:hypothetical protein